MTVRMDKLTQIICDQLGTNPEILKKQTSFANDLGVDSLDVYELFLAVEKEFNISIPDEDAEKLLTVGLLTEYVNTRCEVSGG
jgi:acyl carrier protein